MKNPYRARVDTRSFLNLPGFHAGAYVSVYVEDTSERGLEDSPYGGEGKFNPQPRTILEIADCSNRINLEFDLGTALQRQNSFHKIDSLIEALEEFRDGLTAESTLYKQRQRQLDKIEAEREAVKA